MEKRKRQGKGEDKKKSEGKGKEENSRLAPSRKIFSYAAAKGSCFYTQKTSSSW